MDYFVYKEVSRLIENLAKEGVKEFYSSMIREYLVIEPEDYFKAIGELEELGVIKRKFVTNVEDDGSYMAVLGRDLGVYDPDKVYVKYEIKEDFIRRVKEDK